MYTALTDRALSYQYTELSAIQVRLLMSDGNGLSDDYWMGRRERRKTAEGGSLRVRQISKTVVVTKV